MKPFLILSFFIYVCISGSVPVFWWSFGKSSLFSPWNKYVGIAILARQQTHLPWDCNLRGQIICWSDTFGTPELFEPTMSCFPMPWTPDSLCLNCFGSHITAPNLVARPSQDRKKTLEPFIIYSWQGVEPELGEKVWKGAVSLLVFVWYRYLTQKQASLWWVFYWDKFFNTALILIDSVKYVLGHKTLLLQTMLWTVGWLRAHHHLLKGHLQVSTSWSGCRYHS